MTNQILNLSAIAKLMDTTPKGQSIYRAFTGEWYLLEDEQIKNLKEIIKNEYEKLDEELTHVLVNRGL